MYTIVHPRKMSPEVTSAVGPQTRQANRRAMLQGFAAAAVCAVALAAPFVWKAETEYAQTKQDVAVYVIKAQDARSDELKAVMKSAAADLADAREGTNILEGLGVSFAFGVGLMAGVLVYMKRRPEYVIKRDGSFHYHAK